MQTTEFAATVSLEKHCQKDFLDDLKLYRTFDTKVILVPCWIMMVCMKVYLSLEGDGGVTVS